MAEPYRDFEVDGGGAVLRGDEIGGGPALVALHGLTASRRYVLQGSRALARRGFRLIAYDARGHGRSDPAPAEGGYDYPALVADLDRVIDAVADGPVVLAGHSMGAHTAAAYALKRPERVAALIAVGPAYAGVPADEDSLRNWDALAEGLERDGVEGFLRVYAAGEGSGGWREVLVRVARQRLAEHRSLEEVARALREVPRSEPLEGLSELEFVEPPTLVVASHDEADPGHPYAVAEAWAERIPRATLVSEAKGASPLAWQGGRLSRAIATFLA